MKFPPELVETGDHDAAEDATPEEMERFAKETASKAYVVNMCLRCWVKKWIRRMRIKWAVAFGIGACLNVLGYVSARIAFENAVEKAVQKVTPGIVRQSVVDVLREHKIISAESRPEIGESVASLTGRLP